MLFRSVDGSIEVVKSIVYTIQGVATNDFAEQIHSRVVHDGYVVCGNDLIAKGVIDECTKRGFRVPEDVSVVGFDDISIAATFDPPLTTIRQERNELGRCAYDILNSLIHHIPISKTLLRPKLIERESTARCAHRD